MEKSCGLRFGKLFWDYRWLLNRFDVEICVIYCHFVANIDIKYDRNVYKTVTYPIPNSRQCYIKNIFLVATNRFLIQH